MRRGIPSWLHMPALGIMPRSESRDGVAHTPFASRSVQFADSRESPCSHLRAWPWPCRLKGTWVLRAQRVTCSQLPRHVLPPCLCSSSRKHAKDPPPPPTHTTHTPPHPATVQPAWRHRGQSSTCRRICCWAWGWVRRTAGVKLTGEAKLRRGRQLCRWRRRPAPRRLAGSSVGFSHSREAHALSGRPAGLCGLDTYSGILLPARFLSLTQPPAALPPWPQACGRAPRTARCCS